MRRKASRRQPVGISLFPFLAVLICTMGVIIVMLVIVVRQASQRAQEETAGALAAASARDAEQTAAADAAARKVREAVEDAEWQNEILAKQRTEKAEELAKVRSLLAHVDDHLRRLREQAEQLMRQAQDIDNGKKLTDDELEAARKELARVKDQVAKAEKEVEALKKQATEKQKWFALIPYDGPNGTRRRPIYIECSEVGITLQPEGVTLIADDFNGPLGPGNPLDAALRAKREYMERNGEQGMPYPLLVVRPDGVVAYAVARSALKSWDEEFGYELIDAEKKLAFGQGDPKLAQMLESTVRQARQRQAQRAVAMPRKFQPEDNLSSFRTAEVLSGAPEMAMASRGVGGGGRAGGGVGTAAAGTGTGMTGAGPNRGVGTGVGSGLSGNTSVLTGNPVGGSPGGTGGTGPNAGANGFSLRPGTGNAPGGASGTGGGTGTAAGTGSTAGGTNNNGPAGATGTANSLRPSGGTAANGANTAGGAGAAGGVAGGPNSSGSITGTPGGASASGSPSGSSGGSSAQSSPGEGSPSMSSSVDLSKSSTHPHRRQSNWGLPNAGNHAVAVTRPIRVAALSDRLVLLPDKGDVAASPQNVRVQGEEMTVQELDVFVAAVQKQMSGWGLAVKNGYWKPVLSVDVSPNAERRFQELEVGLKNSGFDVQRKIR